MLKDEARGHVFYQICMLSTLMREESDSHFLFLSVIFWRYVTLVRKMSIHFLESLRVLGATSVSGL